MTRAFVDAARRPAGGEMRALLMDNRAELIARCAARAARRPGAKATPEQIANGLPVFIDQLARALEADASSQFGASRRISGGADGDGGRSEIGSSAATHGADLMRLGFDVDSVVRAYGDLCQSLTELAAARLASFSIGDFRTLNRCLDNATANAVTEFAAAHDASIASRRDAEEGRRLGTLAHELCNALQSSTLAFKALEAVGLPAAGSTGAVLRRGLAAMAALLDTALGEARASAPAAGAEPAFSLAELVSEVVAGARLEAASRGCELLATAVDPSLAIRGDRALLAAALANVTGNAVKFTRPGTSATLQVRAEVALVVIEVADHCGGLPHGAEAQIFKPFSQVGVDRSGLGLGLTIARASLEADGGQIDARNLPGVGCVFSIRLPRVEFG